MGLSSSREGRAEPQPHPGRLQRPAGGQNQPGGPLRQGPAGQHPRLGQRPAHSKGVILPPRVICPILDAHQQGWVPPVRVCGGGAGLQQPPKATTEAVTPLTLTVTRTGPRRKTPPSAPPGGADGKSTPDLQQPAQHPGGPGSTLRTHRGSGQT